LIADSIIHLPVKYRMNGYRIIIASSPEVIMFAVAFEVLPSEAGYQQYLDLAAALRPKLDTMEGFLSIERFRSVTHPGWILSLSFWRDEAALVRWRAHGDHYAAQAQGRRSIFSDYRIRVVQLAVDDSALESACAGSSQPVLGFREHPAIADGEHCTLYESLTNADKRIALFDFTDAASALAWRAEKHPQTRVQCGTVQRDYGMFNRAQAPQQFTD
jgi:heme-degrading monooxygenase HmoA